MIRLRIDGQEVDIDEKLNPATSVGIADIQDPESTASGYTKTAEVPFTPRNMRIFGFVNDLSSKEQFNNALHTAEYLDDDTVVMQGIAQIEKFTYTSGAQGQVTGGAFHVSVVGAAFEWITRAKEPINALRDDQTVTYEMQSVYENSVSETPSLVKFFPVDRGAFWREVDSVKVARTALDLRDYHPFVNVWRLMRLIFGKFTVKTSMQAVFEKLYFSGYMPQTEDASYIKEENDFKCGTTHGEAEIPHITDSYAHFKPNIFDRWTSIDESYYVATKGILSIPPWAPASHTIFTPTCALSAAFKISLTFISSIGKNGEFIDRFSFGGANELYSFTMKDSAEAQEENMYLTDFPWQTQNANRDKYLCWFKLREPERFEGVHKVLYDNNGALMEDTLIASIKKEGQYLFLPWLGGSLGKYYFRTWGGEKFDFGKRDFVAEFGAVRLNDGKITFKLDTTTNSHSIKEGEWYLLDCVLYSSEMETVTAANPLTLKIEIAELTPEFKNAIGLGDKVSIATIGGTATQLEFLAALRQMFNLMFYTNPLTQEVFVEPRTAFYNLTRKDMIDWREKIDYAKEVTVEELGGDVGNALKMAYTEGSDVVKRYNWKNHTELGAYSTPLLNKVADETKELVNPIFTPFLRRKVDSVGMVLPQNVAEKTQDIIGEVDLDITPIVGYCGGVQDRTGGTDKQVYPKYPALLFQDIAARVNLGFDNLQAAPIIPGLNQYYQDNISSYNYGRRITMYLKINPQDVEALLMPNTQKRDLRGVFVIRHDGEDIACLLEKISDYNAAGGASTKCQFITDPNIRLTGDDTVVVTYAGKYIAYDNTAIEYYKKR